jgi:hypothetical protein
MNHSKTSFPSLRVRDTLSSSPRHPFLLFVFFNCEDALSHAVQPYGVNITCPKDTTVTQMTDAIKAGQITWQAYDWDALTEVYGPNLIGLGNRLSNWLDDTFAGPNVTRKRVMQIVDVPGAAASIVPGITKAGIKGLYFGHLSIRVPDGMPGECSSIQMVVMAVLHLVFSSNVHLLALPPR